MSKITIYSPPATAQIKACAVDFDLRRAPVPVHLVQYDKTIPILAVSLYKGSSPYTLPADAEVNVRMNKRNNLCVYNPALGCNESRDVVYVAVTPQMTTQDGTFEPILEVVINSGVAGTSPMQLVIRRNPVQEDAIEDTSEAKTLTEFVSQAAASATAAAQSAGAAVEDAGKAAASATAAAESDEHAAATAQNIKDSLDQIASNAAAVSQLKENMAKLKDGKISKFYASSQGNTNLPDSDDGRIMDLKLYGKCSQQQYSGKNLLSTLDVSTSTKLGVTVKSVGAGEISVKGTATADALFDYWGQEISVPKGARVLCKVLQGTGSANNTITFFGTNYTNGISTEFGAVSSSTAGVDYKCVLIRIGIKSGETVDCTIGLSLQMDASTDYEPYVGGIPSPNPEYPQEIKSVVKPTVKVMGKNLAVATSGINIFISRVYAGQKYTLYYALVKSDASGGFSLLIYEDEATTSNVLNKVVGISGTKMASGRLKYTFTASATGWLFVNQYASGWDEIMMAAGDPEDDPKYVAPIEQTVTLPYTLNAIPVSSSGNVTIDGQQYIADYVDVERGKLVRIVDSSKLDTTQSIIGKTDWLLATPTETDLTADEIAAFKALASYYPVTNVSTASDQLEGYTVFDYPISLANGWNYVKQQLGDTRDYLYGIDLMTAEAYVNSEYAAALAEIEV